MRGVWHGHLMRVWLAPSRYAPHLGGIETVVCNLARELLEADQEVLVLTHRHPPELPPDEVLDGVRVRRLRFEAPARGVGATARFLTSYLKVRSALDAEPPPDVIHLHGGSSQMFHLARYAVTRGIPLLLTTHGEITGDVERVYQRSVFLRSSFRMAARHASSVTAPSRYALEEAAALAPLIAGKGIVVPNGIRSEHWRATNAPPDSKRVLAWGRLEPQKGFDRLVAAWPHVRRRVPEAELCLAGEGSQLSGLRALRHPGVSFVGRLDRSALVAELESAQFAAVPSRREAFGMSALESLAAGRRVLHSGVPALCDLVGSHGWTAPHDDPQALAGAIVRALAEPPVRVPADAVQQYEWPEVVLQYRRLYDHTNSPAT